GGAWGHTCRRSACRTSGRGEAMMEQRTLDRDSAAVAADCSGGSTLVVKGLQKSYGKRLVVRDVSLQVACGEVVVLLGPNGAGKTTSFYMIVGLVPSDAGTIEVNGSDISSLPIHRRALMGLSYLPQE